ncbi:uncharacterized protein ACLA_014700 [Aspergillus clavatus NRRL 1]|uniref:Uncharacterized protein n=1 Tax=Aspergillus clavatus (strain ATCC 1007 / CBS 513.65 / DSM 816 / NCTC 3887 / NRRL 1 / QM 1276 / 107) TaxID=344612 RepID=A1CBB5_ASPCL|nr:uncharacterized protein ACLA_014700 [Aspergillus clavatus NRRL 1]EAW13033.1 conserved hypothetical protein [Aspergillus clavatus NRRL 1]
MQGLWSRVAPTKSSCRCVSCLSTSASALTSRTTTAASKKRLRLGNSVTALYTSIFAAAALADANAKDKRRHEWAEKIAAVQEEVNELVDEEHRLLEAIQARRKRTVSNGALQMRSFSSLGSFPVPTIPSRRSIHTTRDLRLDQSSQLVEDVADPESSNRLIQSSIFAQRSQTLENIEMEQHNRLVRNMMPENEDDLEDEAPISEHGFFLDGSDIPKWLSGDAVRQKAIRKLALKQLAIRLLLRQSIAHNYAGVPMMYTADFDLPQLNFAELLAELNTLRRRIRLLKTNESAFYDDLAKELRVQPIKEMQQEREKLDNEMERDISLFFRDKMSLPELLLRFANNLLQSTDPDRSYCMKLMILAFTKTHQTDLVELILKTILPHKFPLNSSLIISILTFFRKTKNLKGFDSFLEMLRGDGYPVDLGRLSFYKRQVVNGVEITVPPVSSANPVIYTTLVTAALRFDQPDRADAWLQAGRQHGLADDFSTLYAYLKFNAIRADWRNGVYTLRRSLAFLTSTSLHSQRHVERLIVLMVQLCDTCGKWEVSDALISAAINSGFDWASAAEHQEDVDVTKDPRFEHWQKKADASAPGNKIKPVWEKCFKFASILGEQMEDLIISEERDPAIRWQRMVGLYSRDVLSAMLAGPLDKYRESQPSDPAPPRVYDPEDAKFLEHVDSGRLDAFTATNSIAQKRQQQEIDALRVEITQLKNIVSQLRQTAIQRTSHGSPRDSWRPRNRARDPPATQASEPAPASNNNTNRFQNTERGPLKPFSVRFLASD